MEIENFFDSILVEIGEFGKYQKRICFLILIISSIAYFGSIIFVFETKQVNHRCEVEGCDYNTTKFQPDWWTYAIPQENGGPSKCSKFSRRTNNTDTCDPSDFNPVIVEPCENFIYETEEISILHDFNLQCEENVWKLTLPGTLQGVGLFIGLPFSGILSDRFGRKTVLMWALCISGVIGITRSFSISYPMYMVLEILDPMVRAGNYAICVIIALELVDPKKRPLMSVLLSSAHALGGVFETGIAWLLQSWRDIVRTLYSIHFIIIFYYWLIPESIRWLLVRKRFSEAQNILLTAAKVNGTSLSEETLKKLELYTENKENIKTNSISELFSSKILIVRLITCSICWTCCIFLYNGLTVNAVELSGNSYLDLILTVLVEIPGYITAYFIMNRLGRKISLTSGFLIAGLSCIASIFIPTEIYWLKLVIYLMGKFGASINLLIIYALTSEIFPTCFRNSLLATCSMFGRIGSMLGPQMPLLGTIWEPFPLTLFGSAGLVAAFLTLLLPESMNTKLPNTIKEAESLGKHSSNESQTKVDNGHY